MGRLSTHVLDTSLGRPAEGINWTLYRIGDRKEKICSGRTNIDGRAQAPLLADAEMRVGLYEIVFELGLYFKSMGYDLPKPPFFDKIPVQFNIFDKNENYHVPLLVSPFGYSTYRGS